jgi:hypothetical protein
MTNRVVFAAAAVAVLTAAFALCSREPKYERQQRLRAAERAEEAATRAAVVSRHEAKDFSEIWEGFTYPRRLTIHAQNAAAAAPKQRYWIEQSEFNVFRRSDGTVLLVFKTDSANLVELSVSPAQLEDILSRYKPDHVGSKFLLIFSMTGASPYRLQLASEVEPGADGEASSRVTTDDARGEIYSGRLEEFVIIGRGIPPAP